jgi:dihydrofolate synthase/folylpolyglutamate synthase
VITTYEEALRYLDDHIGRGMRPGLERIEGLLEMMSRPDRAFPIVHIAGTNGKTSTSRMVTMLLVAHGLTTGTFTSPHLIKVEERFSINGAAIDEEQLLQAAVDVSVFADIYEDRYAELSYFELTAAMAFALFAEEAVDAAVVEVGLGGRLDATNVCAGAVSVLTSVGLEHQQYLGDTLAAIAGEKLAIVEPESVLITADLPDEVWPVVDEVVRTRSVTEYRFGRDFHIEDAARSLDGWRLDVSGVQASYPDIHLPIRGRHQTVNFAVAVAASEALAGRPLDPQAVIDATIVMSIPGRMEPAGVDPFVLLDGAHNPDGFAALADALREEFPTTTWVLVTAAMDDKDLEGMYPNLAGIVERVVVTSMDSPNAVPAGDLAKRLRPLIGAPVHVAADPAAALSEAVDLAGPQGSVLVAGSLYLVGAVRAVIAEESEIHRNER